MKEIMIEQLKKELEKNLMVVVEAKEKEALMAQQVNSMSK